MSSATVPALRAAGERRAADVLGRVRELARRPATLALAAYLGVSVLLFLPAWVSPGSALIGPSGDSGSGSWMLSWTPYALSHGHDPLLTTWISAPDGANLMWNPLMPLAGLMLWPVSALAGPTVAYNLLATLCPALSALACFVLLRRWVTRPAAAFAGGLLYGFSPFITAQVLGHLTFAFAPVVPLVALLVDEIVVRQRRSAAATGAALGGLCVVQLLLFEEMLASMAVVAAVVVAVLVAQHRDQVRARAGHVVRALGMALAVFVPLAAVPLGVQFFGGHTIRGTVQPPNMFVTDLLNLVVPTSATLLSPAPLASVSQHFSGNIIENDGYLGLPLLGILAFTALRFRRDPLVRGVSVALLAVSVLSLGPHLHVGGRDTGVPMPWWLVQQIPLLGNMLPSRLAEYTALLAAVLAAVFVDRVVLAGGTPRRAPLLAVAVAALTLVPLVPVPTASVAAPPFFTGDQARRIPEGSVALVAPFSDGWTSVEPMLWQQAAGMRFRMPEGYVLEPGPDGHALPGAPLSPLSTAMLAVEYGDPVATDPARLAVYRADLSRWQVQTVVVGPMAHGDVMVRLLTDLLGRPPVADQGVEVWWNVAAPGPAG